MFNIERAEITYLCTVYNSLESRKKDINVLTNYPANQSSHIYTHTHIYSVQVSIQPQRQILVLPQSEFSSAHNAGVLLFVTVSDALKPQRRFTISGLSPASVYQLRIEAHNIAGSSTAEFTFVTLTKEGGESHGFMLTHL